MYQDDLLDLLNMALTCKQLGPVAHNILYHDVSLLSSHLDNGTNVTPIVSFFHTLTNHPELACQVERLVVWFWKGLPIAESKQYICPSAALRGTAERIHPTSSLAQLQWMEHYPIEAWCCAQTLASLPKLKALELYLKTPPTRELGSGGRHVEGSEAQSRSTEGRGLFEILRLAKALASTQVQDLTLSTGLNELQVAKLPSLKTLTVDYPRRNPFGRVSQGRFTSVEKLIIQRLATDAKYGAGGLSVPLYTKFVNNLIASLPNVRTMEFTSGVAAKLCSIPTYVEKIIIRPE
jgi:hypothetical protein